MGKRAEVSTRSSLPPIERERAERSRIAARAMLDESAAALDDDGLPDDRLEESELDDADETSSPDGIATSDDPSAEEAAGEGLETHRTSDWGSLLADLSRPKDHPTFRVHDRTHLEFALDYRLDASSPRERFEWEAYFFAPESLRLDSRTYSKEDIYEDLLSYVRFAVPECAFADLATTGLDRVAAVVAGGDEDAISRELRLFACQVRAAGVTAKRRILDGLSGEGTRAQALAAAEHMIEESRELGTRLRGLLAQIPEHDPITTISRWIDEDVSRLLETLLGNLALGLRRADGPPKLVLAIERAAVAEARYRKDHGLEGVGRVGMKTREVEQIEFRRHVLKRFTSSVLWLTPVIRPASTWVLHLLYAVAASVAMAFATIAALVNGAVQSDGTLSTAFFRWAIVVILAYAAKDRIKALLQSLFTNVVSRHFPDRSWHIGTKGVRGELGAMEEQSGFVKFDEVPPEVLAVRRRTRSHPLEEAARPETVLFHRKEVTLHSGKVRKVDGRFDAVSEIYRLDLRRWLAHTDDPKRDFVFADPDAGVVSSATAPRVYNIGVVYRLRRDTDHDAPWHRVRVVVTRKGIRRIDIVS